MKRVALYHAVTIKYCFISVPSFDVEISQDYNDPLYTGTNLKITCDITLSTLVDIPVIVSNQWTRNGNEITENTITEDLIRENNLVHTATLEFFPLYHVTDDGEYRCSVYVVADTNDNYVTNISDSVNTTLDILGWFWSSHNYGETISV